MLDQGAAKADENIMHTLDRRHLTQGTGAQFKPSLQVQAIARPLDPDDPVSLDQIPGGDAKVVEHPPVIGQGLASPAGGNPDASTGTGAQFRIGQNGGMGRQHHLRAALSAFSSNKFEHRALQAGMKMAIGFVQQDKRTRRTAPDEGKHRGQLQPSERQIIAMNERMLAAVVLEENADPPLPGSGALE